MGLIAYKVSPCLKCAIRQPGCHGSCEGYAEWSKARAYAKGYPRCDLSFTFVSNDVNKKSQRRRWCDKVNK